MQVTVPQVALDLAQLARQGGSIIRIVMRQPLHILLHHGDPHGDMEPVQDMLGGRGHVLGQVNNRIAAICHERHRLVFLPALLFQDLMKSPFWLGVVTLDKAKVAGWAICRDGFPTVTSKRDCPATRDRTYPPSIPTVIGPFGLGNRSR